MQKEIKSSRLILLRSCPFQRAIIPGTKEISQERTAFIVPGMESILRSAVEMHNKVVGARMWFRLPTGMWQVDILGARPNLPYTRPGPTIRGPWSREGVRIPGCGYQPVEKHHQNHGACHRENKSPSRQLWVQL